MKLNMLLDNVPKNLVDIRISGVACDSRIVKDGFAFVCISGAVQDGHEYARQAVEKGATVIICERSLGLDNEIIVDDGRMTFAQMSAKWFGNPAEELKIIGITGTNGKTTVSYLVKAILEAAGHKVGLVGTNQNMVCDEVLPSKNTTPSPYELNSLFDIMVKSECDYAVMEVSSHALDQNRVAGITFEAALFTNLSQDHLDYHVTMENYLLAKKKLFKSAKTGIINADDAAAASIMSGLDCNIKTYSLNKSDADFYAQDIKYLSDGVSFKMVCANGAADVSLQTAGEFSVYNALCAGSLCSVLGLDVKIAADALTGLSGVKGRAEVVPTGKDFTVIIDYAHTPDGLENILNTFTKIPKNRLVVLFGCGGDRDKGKRAQMGEIAARLADYVIFTSDNPRAEEPQTIINDILSGVRDTETPYEVIENRVDAIEFAIKNAQPQDIIVLAGKGHETYQIIGTGTIHLDEREVVASAVSKLS